MQELQLTNYQLLDVILRLHRYLQKRISGPTKDNPNYSLDEGHLEVSPDASLGIEHTWDESYHNGSPYNFQQRTLSSQELGDKLRSFYRHLRAEGLIRAEREVLRELAEQKLNLEIERHRNF